MHVAGGLQVDFELGGMWWCNQFLQTSLANEDMAIFKPAPFWRQDELYVHNAHASHDIVIFYAGSLKTLVASTVQYSIMVILESRPWTSPNWIVPECDWLGWAPTSPTRVMWLLNGRRSGCFQCLLTDRVQCYFVKPGPVLYSWSQIARFHSQSRRGGLMGETK